MQERVKGLSCLYRIEKSIALSGTNLNRILKGVVSLLPSGWMDPRALCASIICNDQRFVTANFRQTRWKQSANIRLHGKKVGVVEVYYLKKKKGDPAGRFPRKRELLDIIALRLSRVVERVDAEDRSQEYQERYRGFLEEAPVLASLFDSKLNYLDANGVTLKLTGLKRRNLLGKNLADISPDVKQSGRYEEYMNVLRTGKPFFIEEVHAHPRFGDKYFSVRAFKAGKNLGLISLDITEPRQNEEKLREISHYTRSLIEASLDPLVTISPDGKITDVNKATELVTEVSREELIGSDFSQYFTEPEKAKAGYKEVLSKGHVKDYPLEIRRKSGESAYVSYNASLYKNRSGDVAGIFAAARDVTERKKAEDKVREASLYARGLIEASLDPLVTISPDGKITDVNKATELVTEVSREELIGSDFSQYFTEPEKAREGYEEVLKEGLVRDYALVLRSRSGKLTDVLYNATLYRDTEGKSQGIFAAARDVTRLRRTEKELKRYSDHLQELVEEKTRNLQESEGRLTHALDAGELGIWALNTKTGEAWRSFRHDHIFGYKTLLPNWTYKMFLDHVLPEDRKEVDKKFGEALSLGKEWNFECRIRRNDGTIRWIWAQGKPRFNDYNEVVQMVGIVKDITESKQMETTLRDSEARYRLLLESMSDAVIVFDKQLRYVLVNDAGAGLAHAPREELMGRKASDVDPRFEKTQFFKTCRQVMETHGAAAVTEEFIYTDGRKGWHEVRVYPVPEGVLCVATDVTERKRLDEMKDQFISAVTHELRTPLVSIKGYTDYLLSGNLGPLSPKVESSINVVREASERLLAITNELLDYRRLVMGRFQLVSRALDLKEVIDDCVMEIQPFIRQKKQTLQLDLPEEPLLVQGDRERLTQVIMNLLNNASKFSLENGQITIRAKKEPTTIKVSISDTGIGIEAGDLTRVFEPFAAIQKPSYIKGTGLGLSVSKGLINAHGGDMWAESEGKGKGATFNFTVPNIKIKDDSASPQQS